MNEKIYTFMQTESSQKLIHLEICGMTYPNKYYQITRNKSKTACIEYIDSGSGCVSIGEDKFYPSQGDSYFLQSNFDQHYFSDSSTPWKKYFINVSGPLIQSMTEGYGLEKQFYYPNLNIKNELLGIIELAKNNKYDCTNEVIEILHRIFFSMYCHIQQSKKNSIAREMKNYLNSKIESDFKLEKLCDFVHKSESQVIKIYKKEYGTTPYKYLLNKRIALSQKLLVNTNLSVKEISARLMFSSEYYFSNIFKKKVGISPLHYRKGSDDLKLKVFSDTKNDLL